MHLLTRVSEFVGLSKNLSQDSIILVRKFAQSLEFWSIVVSQYLGSLRTCLWRRHILCHLRRKKSRREPLAWSRAFWRSDTLVPRAFKPRLVRSGLFSGAIPVYSNTCMVHTRDSKEINSRGRGFSAKSTMAVRISCELTHSEPASHWPTGTCRSRGSGLNEPAAWHSFFRFLLIYVLMRVVMPLLESVPKPMYINSRGWDTTAHRWSLQNN